MKAAVYDSYGSPDVLRIEDVPTPIPGDDEVLVRVHASSINDYDYHLLTGRPYINRIGGPLTPRHRILGSDIAGRVEAVGRDVTRFKPGDDVYGDMSVCGFGAFAEYVCARESAVALKPMTLTFEQAATVPQAGGLAALALRCAGGPQLGSRVLVNGAGGGVGTIAIQIAKSFQCEVTGVDVGRKLDGIRSVGADHVIDYTKQDFADSGVTYDLIVDMASHRSMRAYRRSLSHGGTAALIGGSIPRVMLVMATGPVVSTFTDRKVRMPLWKPTNDDDVGFLSRLLAGGAVVPLIDSTYSLADVPDALRRFGEQQHVGKIVVTIDESSNKKLQLEESLAKERSAREQAEGLLDERTRELWREREQYRLMVENASDIVIQLGSNGMIDWISPSAHRILGHEPSSLVGTALRGLVHSDDVETVAEAVVAAMATEAQQPAFEVRVRKADGFHVWMSLLMQRAIASHLVVSMRQADAQVREREAREASETQYRLLAENATDVVFLADLGERVTWISPNVTRVLGWEPAELVGTDMAALEHPNDTAAMHVHRARLRADEEAIDPDGHTLVRVRTSSGTYRWMSSKTTIVRDPAGQRVGAVTGLRDVDDLARERERAQLDRAVLRATLDSLVDPHVVLSAVRDPTGQIIDFTFIEANAAALEYNRVPRHELLGMRLTELLPGHAESELLGMYVHAVESGETLVLDDHPYQDEIYGGVRYFDLRAVRIGDNLSYTWRDVSERHLAQEALARSESQYRLLAENSSDVVVRLSTVGTVLWASPSMTEALGWMPEEWLGKTPDDFAHPDDLEPLRLAREGLRAGTLPLSHGMWITRFRARAKDGSYHWIETHSRDFTNDEGRRDGLVVSFRIIDAEVEVEQQLDRRARFDDLTGALKRDEAMDRLTSIGRRLRQPGNESAVLFVDVDGFKNINDTVGHAAGDTVLSTFVSRWRDVVRVSDSVARTGGDEFLVILDGIHDVEEAVTVAEKVRLAALEPVITAYGTVHATVSIGVTLVHPVETSDAMIARADAAMYQAKRQGRNTVAALTGSG